MRARNRSGGAQHHARNIAKVLACPHKRWRLVPRPPYANYASDTRGRMFDSRCSTCKVMA